MSYERTMSHTAAAPDPLKPSQQQAPLTGAEKYEDDKKRITSSCFAKRDETGVLLQTYITHVRVEEDGAHPSSPPPPTANPANKKQRAIIVAVKSSGRVWLHKARENHDGTFQIGKSWPMEDLQSIESFAHHGHAEPEQQKNAQWAGPTGFTITMQKPYFWKANTAREKDFFIQSLVKIYRKYTKGDVPHLIGFDEAQKSQIIGMAGGPPAAAATAPSPPHHAGIGALRPPPVLGPDGRRPSTASSMDGGRSPSFVSVEHPSSFASPSRSAAASPYRPPSRDVAAPPPIAALSPNRMSNARNVSSGHDTSRSDPFQSVDSTMGGLGPDYAMNGNGASRQIPTSLTAGETSDPYGAHKSNGYGMAVDSVPPPVPQALPERRRPPLPESAYAPSPSPSVEPPKPLAFKSQKTQPQTQAQVSPQPPPSQPRQQPSGSFRMPGGFESPASANTPAVTPTPEVSNQLGEPQPPAQEEVPPLPVDQADGDKPRPGLGPMTGARSDVASRFRKAAAAANAFKPRAGGAGARLMAEKEKPKTSEDGGGITNVFHAPSKSRSIDTPTDVIKPTLLPTSSGDVQQPTVTVSSPQSPSNGDQPENIIDDVAVEPAENTIVDQAAQTQKLAAERKLRKRRSDLYVRCFDGLGIDSSVLQGREHALDEVLSDFGWEKNVLQDKKLDDMEHDIRREINRLEAGAWLGSADHKDDRTSALDKMLDKVIAECDEMEGLLTLYSVELNTLNADVHFIETQSQGLQVQTANQKLLQTELQSLISTVTIGEDQLEPLTRTSITDPAGLETVEQCLLILHKALSTIDPSSLRGRAIISADRYHPQTEFRSMRALQERKDMYVQHVASFLDRMFHYMGNTFGSAFIQTEDAIASKAKSARGMRVLDNEDHEVARRALWQYNALMLFARDFDINAWAALMDLYTERAQNVFRNETRDSIIAWKKMARKASTEEQAAVFTTPEQEHQSLTTTAMKLTVKRSQTLTRGFRSGSTAKKELELSTRENKLYPYEVFAEALHEVLPIIASEQNFIIEFFHASTQGFDEFAECVNLSPPEHRHLPDTTAKKMIEPDRTMAKNVRGSMEKAFASWPVELQGMIDWALATNELNVVGILCALERNRAIVEDSNQEYISAVLFNLHNRLTAVFTRFIDEQIRAISDTRVKIKKRKGVIGFMRVIPNFTAFVESMLPDNKGSENLEIRAMIQDAYQRIHKAMWESLKQIAKDMPVGGLGQTTDPDDKEALNYHILLIENMHHYINTVDEGGDEELTLWKEKARTELTEHKNLYINAIIRRPLGKLIDYLESAEIILSSSKQVPAAIAHTSPSHSRSAFKKVMASYTSKDIRKGVDALRARVVKHFGDGDEPALSQKLIQLIEAECEKKYAEINDRTRRLADSVYEKSVEVDFTSSDIQAAFRK